MDSRQPTTSSVSAIARVRKVTKSAKDLVETLKRSVNHEPNISVIESKDPPQALELFLLPTSAV